MLPLKTSFVIFFRNNLFLVLPFLLYSLVATAQYKTEMSVETSAQLGIGKSPLWMRSLKFGMVPNENQTISTILSIQAKPVVDNPRFNVDYGFVGGFFAGKQNQLILPEAYVNFRKGRFELTLGRIREVQGLVDTTLSSGSYVVSGNAMPIPKIDFKLKQYLPILPNGAFSIKGNFAHGFFENDRLDAKGVKLHAKSFYGKIGDDTWRFNMMAGFNHQVQWGGTSKTVTNGGKLPAGSDLGNDLYAYKFVFTGRSTIGTDTSKIRGINDKQNRVGNTVASIDFATSFNFSKYKILLFRQFLVEDGSLFYLNNVTDGLNGISIQLKDQSKKPLISHVVFEYFSSLSQGGPFVDNNPFNPNFRGNDNYYNNGQYFNGWTNKQKSLGTPFFFTNKDLGLKRKEIDQGVFFNNFVQAFYLGLEGFLPYQIKYNSRFSISKNWGQRQSNPISPFKNQISWGIFAQKEFKIYNLGNFSCFGEYGLDVGSFLEEYNYGFRLGLIKKGVISTLRKPFIHGHQY